LSQSLRLPEEAVRRKLLKLPIANFAQCGSHSLVQTIVMPRRNKERNNPSRTSERMVFLEYAPNSRNFNSAISNSYTSAVPKQQNMQE
jgi:hypothetical protein